MDGRTDIGRLTVTFLLEKIGG